MSKIWKFKNEANAESFAARCNKAKAIVLGDDGRYWVVSLALMVVLEAAGFEVL